VRLLDDRREHLVTDIRLERVGDRCQFTSRHHHLDDIDAPVDSRTDGEPRGIRIVHDAAEVVTMAVRDRQRRPRAQQPRTDGRICRELFP
jgi:hypothetical protein